MKVIIMAKLKVVPRNKQPKYEIIKRFFVVVVNVKPLHFGYVLLAKPLQILWMTIAFCIRNGLNRLCFKENEQK